MMRALGGIGWDLGRAWQMDQMAWLEVALFLQEQLCWSTARRALLLPHYWPEVKTNLVFMLFLWSLMADFSLI